MTKIQKITIIAGSCLLILSVAILFFVKTEAEFFSTSGTMFSQNIFGTRQAQREPIKVPVLPTDVYISSGFFQSTGITTIDIRREVIEQLISQGFTGFVTLPYVSSGHNALTASGLGVTYAVHQVVSGDDSLDEFLSGLTLTGINELKISKTKRSRRTDIFLFKTTQDLEQLGYAVVSHRTRTNKDEGYRRTNISQAFKLLGNVRILLPGDQLTFLDDAQYDGNAQENYLEGYAIIENEEEKVYGGGICGASTALYQGIVTNKALEPTKLRSHSKWFTNLYTATINGELIKSPGIDSAIYDGVIDLYVKNISDHPIIIVMNYDGTFGGVEEIFSLGFEEDLGSIQYVGGYRTSMQIPDTSPLPADAPVLAEADSFDSDWIRADNSEETSEHSTSPIVEPSTPPPAPEVRMKTIYGGCHTWLINGVEKKSCYREIK